MEIKKRDIANFTGGVTTDDGRQLYGLDAETYLKVAIQFLFFFFCFIYNCRPTIYNIFIRTKYKFL